MKILPVLASISITIPLLSSASSPALYRIDGGPIMQLETSPISDTFAGSANLTADVCPHNCTLSLDIEVTDIASTVTIFSINNASLSGGLLCGSAFVQFDSFPWTGAVNHFQLPTPGGTPDLYDDVTFSIGLVDIEFPACSTHCKGTVSATYNNEISGVSTLSLSGTLPPLSGSNSCSIFSSLTSTSGHDYLIWH